MAGATVRQVSSWALLGGLALVATLPPGGAGCAGPLEQAPAGTAASGDVVAATLAASVDAAILPTLDRFGASLDGLDAAVQAWQAAPDDPMALEGVRTAWLDAMGVWQEAEVMQVGPAASSLTAVGGADLRDRIYSWPSVNPCRVDQETVERDYDTAGFADSELVNVLGLDALEYLAYAGADNACPGQVEINAEGTWDALEPDTLASHRADYAAVLVADLAASHATLMADWQGGFGDALAAGSDPYSDPQQALNGLYDALFYLEKTTKDRKLATPLGLVDCTTGTCPEAAESLPSGTSHLWIQANLRGFRALFEGDEAGGFDDLLADLGHADLAADVIAHLDNADAAAAALTTPIDAAVVADPEAVEAVRAAVNEVAQLLKGDVATVLTLTVPAEAAGDND